jgi:hypothetical protein
MRVSDMPSKISRRGLLQYKRIYQLLRSYTDRKSILFIVGCQRSSTTLVSRIFEKDLDTKPCGEFSKLSSQDVAKGIRLNPLDVVQEEIRKDRAPFIVLKPLVESQNILQLLGYLEESKAL